MDASQIEEFVTHSWYSYSGGDEAPLHPSQGQTTPNYTGPQPPYDYLDTDYKYSWLKSPRYNNQPMEVGPLARMLVAYAAGHTRVRELVNQTLAELGLGPEALFSTLGRVAARGIETLAIAEQMDGWLSALEANMNAGNHRHPQWNQMGSGHLASSGEWLGHYRSAPWCTRALGEYRQQGDQPLPDGGTNHLERFTA